MKFNKRYQNTGCFKINESDYPKIRRKQLGNHWNIFIFTIHAGTNHHQPLHMRDIVWLNWKHFFTCIWRYVFNFLDDPSSQFIQCGRCGLINLIFECAPQIEIQGVQVGTSWGPKTGRNEAFAKKLSQEVHHWCRSMRSHVVLLEDHTMFRFLHEHDKPGNKALIDFWGDGAKKKWDQQDASSK